MSDLLRQTERGFYCPPGDFYIDPWRSVPRALVTHAHADHFARECDHYLVAAPGERLFRLRLGERASIQPVPYGDPMTVNGVRVSFHPAGHILGSAQIRLEYGGEVAVVSGDYKLAQDSTCAPFEPIRCHTFVTEATFALPIYNWPEPETVFADINDWWRENQDKNKASILYGYALGKAQRLLAGIDPTIGPIYTHGAVENLNAAYRASGVPLPETTYVSDAEKPDYSRALILAPPSARGTSWTRRFGAHASGFASGWMRIRGTRRRRAMDRGLVLSDHADWPGLLGAIEATGAEQVWVTHGYTAVLARWLNDRGVNARAIATRYRGEAADDEDPS